MSKIELRVRDLKSGDGSLKAFDDEAAACAWLAARPRFVDVVGTATLDLPREIEARLRAALRPLDAEEKAADRALQAAVEAVTRVRNEEAAKRDQLAAEALRAAAAKADPNRPMEVHFRYDQELTLTDPNDTRAITAEAREAVMAWVRERDEWVAGRGQVVGDAKVTVWPGPLPASAGGERAQGGSFIPVAAPEKRG
jgi:hypothetical protein